MRYSMALPLGKIMGKIPISALTACICWPVVLLYGEPNWEGLAFHPVERSGTARKGSRSPSAGPGGDGGHGTAGAGPAMQPRASQGPPRQCPACGLPCLLTRARARAYALHTPFVTAAGCTMPEVVSGSLSAGQQGRLRLCLWDSQHCLWNSSEKPSRPSGRLFWDNYLILPSQHGKCCTKLHQCSGKRAHPARRRARPPSCLRGPVCRPASTAWALYRPAP